MAAEPQIESPDMPSFAPKLWGIALLVAAIVATGLWLVVRFNNLDLARDLQTWQEKLNLIAESRTADVNHWVEGNFKDLRALADNPSLKLYMTELQLGKDEDQPAAGPAEPAQKTYLRNVLLFTAERAGFGTVNTISAIHANVQPESKNGLAIVDNHNQIVVSTVMQPAMRDAMLENAKKSAAGQETLIDIRKDKDGTPYIGFVVPIFSIQGERDANSQIGRVVGVKIVDANLFGLLKHPGVTEKTLEVLLVRSNGGKLDYISPLEDGTEALGKEITADPEKSAEARLVQTVGNFTIDLKDYRDKPVLATSRSIAGTPWTLVAKIDRSEALVASDQRRTSTAMVFFLLISVIVLIVIAIWRYAHSKRSMMMSLHFKKLAAWATAQEQLLRLVADNQPEPIYIVDSQQIYRFANRQAASEAGMSPESVAGKTLADMRGAAHAAQIAEQCTRALKTRQITYDVQRLPQDGQEKIIRSAYIPIDHIPMVTLPEGTPGVLVVEQNISEVVHEREQRLATHRQLIETLVRLVDKRDPFAANHSQLVSQIAREVAIEMELDNVTVETTATAGSLMNIGKIVVPTELLTKTDKLTPDERRIIHDSMNAAAELLSGISFDGPVAETMHQWQEKWDGSGPLRLEGESILISARIIAVANAFVGMISPRSWRTAMPIESATKYLIDQSGKNFDRRVVIALVNYVENHHGREWLKKVLENSKDAA